MSEEPKIVTRAERAVRKAKKSIGLGDVVASVATPIARILHLSCVDPATNQLRPNSPCAKKKKRLNDAIPNINPLG